MHLHSLRIHGTNISSDLFFRPRPDKPEKTQWWHCPKGFPQEDNSCSWKSNHHEASNENDYFRVDFEYHIVVIANNSLGTAQSISDPLELKYETKYLGIYIKKIADI